VGNGINTVTTGAGNDTVYSGVDADTITTGTGDDTIAVKGGIDTITAGAGNDTLIADFSLATSAVSINALAGTAAAGYAGNISGLGIATFGGVENFKITSGSFNDTITTGGGADVVRSGAGSDAVNLAGGNDEAIYTMASNEGAINVYQGGAGVDTLTLELTETEWLSAAVQADIAGYQAHLASESSDPFVFASGLKASEFEALNVIVDGVALDPNSTTVNDVAALNEDDSVTQFVSVLANDDAAALAYSVTLISGPSEGALTFNAGTDGAPDGSYSFNPGDDFEDLAEGQTRDVSFVYEVQDGYRGATQATVTVTVTGTYDAPIVTSDAASGSVTEAGHDKDGIASATGTLTSNASATWSSQEATGKYGSFAIDSKTGAWTYQLDNGNTETQALAESATVTETFTATVTDYRGATATQTVTVTVTGTNDAPIVTSDATSASGSVTEAGHDKDGVASATGTLTSSDVDNNASATWSSQEATGKYGSFAIDSKTGAWTYQLDNGNTETQALAEGATVTETFTATVTDDKGATATQTVTVTVTGTNDAPVAEAAQASGNEGTTISGQLTASDIDYDTLSFALVTGPAKGTVLINADGSFVFTPLADFKGDDVFSYSVTDEYGATSTATVSVTVGTPDGKVMVFGENVSAIATGGLAQDKISFGSLAGSNDGSASADGGDGDDTISFGSLASSNDGSASADGGDGDDTISFGSLAGFNDGSASAVGGAGVDKISFGSLAGYYKGSAIATGGLNDDTISFGQNAGSNQGTASADGGLGGDTISFGQNAGGRYGSASAVGDAGNDTITFGNGAGDGYGTASADGGLGDDTISFGQNAGSNGGSVSVNGGAGEDTFIFGAGAGNLRINLGKGDGNRDSVTFEGSVKSTTILNWEYSIDDKIDVFDDLSNWKLATSPEGVRLDNENENQSLTFIGITASSLNVSDLLM
jgi:VCBS repeat-containing protein